MVNKFLLYHLFFLLFVFLVGCRTNSRIDAFSEYVNETDLASYLVRTPDPALNCPPVGQKLYIRWNLPEMTGHRLYCKLHLRFKDRTEKLEIFDLPFHFGTYVYELLNEQYFIHQGILSYHIEIFCEDQLIEEASHHMWVELIKSLP